MTDPDNAAEPAEGDAFEARPVGFGELARWRDRAIAAERDAAQMRARVADVDAWLCSDDGVRRRELEAERAELTRMRAVVEEARAVLAALPAVPPPSVVDGVAGPGLLSWATIRRLDDALDALSAEEMAELRAILAAGEWDLHAEGVGYACRWILQERDRVAVRDE